VKGKSRSARSSQRIRDIAGLGQTGSSPWRDHEHLVNFCRTNRLTRLAQAFEDYERNRQLQDQRIRSLENQINELQLVNHKHKNKWDTLHRIGFDVEAILKTEKVFGA
jgi:hypothetical protein